MSSIDARQANVENIIACEESVQVNAAHKFLAHMKEPAEALPDPKTCAIPIGKPVVIEVSKEKMGLGLSIVGGSDTPLVNYARFPR